MLTHEHRHRHDRGTFRAVWHTHGHRHARPERHHATLSPGGRRLADGPHAHMHRRGTRALLTARAE